MFYSIGPLIWDTTDPAFHHWRAPAGTRGWVDLRSSLQSGTRGGTPGYGFFASDVSLGSGYAVVGQAAHFGHEPATTGHRAVWHAATGFRPDGATMADLLWDHLTRGADPDGQAACRPLMPGGTLNLELHVAGHSLIRRERITRGHAHWNKVRDCLRRQFRHHLEDATSGRLRDREHHRRILDLWCRKYRCEDWHEFVAPELRTHVPGRLPHATVRTDDFNRTDSGTLGTSSEGWSWSTAGLFGAASWAIVSNQASSADTGAWSLARADADLSGDDHHTQISVVAIGDISSTSVVGAVARFASAASTAYSFNARSNNGDAAIIKIVSGTPTTLGAAVHTWSLPDTVRIECNGSTIRGLINGAENQSLTDTDITGNLRGGMICVNASGSGTSTADDFEAADAGDTPISHNLTSTESIGISDAMARLVESFRVITDSLAIATTAELILDGVLLINVTDRVGVREDIHLHAELWREFAATSLAISTTTAADLISQGALIIAVTDALAISTVASRRVTAFRRIQDLMAVSTAASVLIASTAAGIPVPAVWLGDDVGASGVVEISAGSSVRLPVDFGNEPRLIEGASLDEDGALVLDTEIVSRNVTCNDGNMTISLIQADYAYQVSARFRCSVAGDYTIAFTVVLDDPDSTEIVRRVPLRVV